MVSTNLSNFLSYVYYIAKIHLPLLHQIADLLKKKRLSGNTGQFLALIFFWALGFERLVLHCTSAE